MVEKETKKLEKFRFKDADLSSNVRMSIAMETEPLQLPTTKGFLILHTNIGSDIVCNKCAGAFQRVIWVLKNWSGKWP